MALPAQILASVAATVAGHLVVENTEELNFA
jgi:hypothetical protein